MLEFIKKLHKKYNKKAKPLLKNEEVKISILKDNYFYSNEDSEFLNEQFKKIEKVLTERWNKRTKDLDKYKYQNRK